MTAPALLRPIAALAAAGAALTATGCTTERPSAASVATDGGANQCFRGRDVNSFRFANDSVVNIRVGVDQVYRLNLFGPCVGAAFVEGLALRSTGGGGGYICRPQDAELVIPSPTGPQRCPIDAMRRLSPQEVAALDPKQRP